MNSPKYNRTLHLPWSPGQGSDDKVAKSVDSLINVPIVISEKMDGSNTSLEKDGCFARTHAGAPTHVSFDGLKSLHASLKYYLWEDVQIFGEWLYALHSIAYDTLPGYFLMFGIRELYKGDDYWYSWAMVEEWAHSLQLSTVPVLWQGTVASDKELQTLTEELVKQPSAYGETREGVVVRIADRFDDVNFSKCIMKWVRKDHVQTDQHWKSQEIVKNKLKI
jgi:RNA ligase